MRIWNKYYLKSETSSPVRDDMDQMIKFSIGYNNSRSSLGEQAKSSPLTQAIAKNFIRLVQEHTNARPSILSIGTSNGEHENYIKDRLGNIGSWDLTDVDDRSVEFLKNEYPEFKSYKMDILAPPQGSNKKFDFVFVPGILYLFNQSRAQLFFKNLKSYLQPEGLVFFCFRERQTVWTNIIDNYLSPLDCSIRLAKGRLQSRNSKMIKAHHGYRYRLEEVSKMIEDSGFDIVENQPECFETEFVERLPVFNRLGFKPVFKAFVGKKSPYLNILVLKHKEEG
jgi:hypothetical protein